MFPIHRCINKRKGKTKILDQVHGVHTKKGKSSNINRIKTHYIHQKLSTTIHMLLNLLTEWKWNNKVDKNIIDFIEIEINERKENLLKSRKFFLQFLFFFFESIPCCVGLAFSLILSSIYLYEHVHKRKILFPNFNMDSMFLSRFSRKFQIHT